MSNEITFSSFSQLFDNLGITSDNETDYFYNILYNLSVTISDKRLEKKMNQKEFAEFLGVSQPMISKYESGDYNFTIKQICSLSAKLGLKPVFNLLDNVAADEFNYSDDTQTNLFIDKKIEEAA